MAWRGDTKLEIKRTFTAEIDKKARFIKNVRMSIRKALEVILKRALELCPEDKGHLYRSGRIVMDKNGLGGIVIFGDKKAWYALYVHEKLEQTFKKPGAMAKWLEIAVEETKDEVDSILQKGTWWAQ